MVYHGSSTHGQTYIWRVKLGNNVLPKFKDFDGGSQGQVQDLR